MNFKGFLILSTTLIMMVPALAIAKPPVQVYVSILPQKYFVERIAGKYATVHVMVKPGKSPATYSPSPDQIKKLTTSDIYFTIGVPFENGILQKIKAVSDTIKIVDTRKGIVLREMKSQNHHDPGHKTDEKSHTGKDPHIWMSPLLVKKQAGTMAEALIKFAPNHSTIYRQNLDKFLKDLDNLHKNLAATLKQFKGENIFVFHPVFGYLTDTYGMNQVAIETMGKSPKGKELSAIIKKAKSEKTRVIFVQPQFDRHLAQKIAESIHGVVVSIDPLAFDYLSNMESIAHTISSTLARQNKDNP
ncbi:MAG: zinc ABC transporter solute-binding protein [Desulfobacteraceae bacterium]|nr:zinc ABC transporter solute-binding protein [Desulfobacteraceae bacterium]